MYQKTACSPASTLHGYSACWAWTCYSSGLSEWPSSSFELNFELFFSCEMTIASRDPISHFKNNTYFNFLRINWPIHPSDELQNLFFGIEFGHNHIWMIVLLNLFKKRSWLKHFFIPFETQIKQELDIYSVLSLNFLSSILFFRSSVQRFSNFQDILPIDLAIISLSTSRFGTSFCSTG